MIIRFTATPAMLYGAQRAVMRHVKWMYLVRYFTFVVFPLTIIGITLAYGGSVVGTLRANAVIYLSLVLLLLVGVPLATRWSAGRLLKNTPAFQGELEYSFGDDGVDVRTSVSTAHITWAGYIRAAETDKFFLLFHNKTMVTFFPKSAFTDQSEREVFRALVSRHLGERAAWARGAASS